MKFHDLLLIENWAKAKKLIKVKNPLFHGTSQLISILRDSQIKSSRGGAQSKFNSYQHGISVTRNLDRVVKDWLFGYNILVLDGDKLKTKYKIKPVDYWADSGKADPSFEFEERILADKLPIRDYLKGIIVKDNSPKKLYYPEWASWKEEYDLPFDVVVYSKGKYLYVKDLVDTL